jgi:general stress protein 26
MAKAEISAGEAQAVERLLAAARDAIAEIPFCWVVTPDETGGANARIVRGHPSEAGEDSWTRWFLARPNSRKADEIRRSGRVTLAFQHASGTAYVTMAGPAALIDDRVAVTSRLTADADGSLAARLVAVRMVPDRLEIHIRGVTAEPWGQGRTLLVRRGLGAWSLQRD